MEALKVTVLHNATDTMDLPNLAEDGSFDPKGKFFGYTPECRLVKAYSLTLDFVTGASDEAIAESVFQRDNLGQLDRGPRRSLSVGDVVVIHGRGWPRAALAVERIGFVKVEPADVIMSLAK